MRILSNESDIINDIKYYIRNKQNSQVQLNANLLFWGNLCENAYLQGLTDTKNLSCGITGFISAIPQHIVLGRFFVGLVVCISQVMVILWFRNCSGTFAGVILGCFASLGRNDSIFVLFLLANWRTISDFQ
jgi:hypothetical protein